MTPEQLSDLISYAESAVADGFPFEVTGEELTVVLAALKEYVGMPAGDE